MSSLSRVLLVGLFAFLVIGCEQSALDTPDETAVEARSGDPIPGRYIVVMSSDALVAGKAPAQQAEGLAAEYGVEPQYVYGGGFTGFAGAVSGRELARLADDVRVAYIEPDRRVVLDPITILGGNGKGKKPGGGSQPEQSTPWGITRVNGGSGTPAGVAWIVDTGIDTDHPDLNVDASRGFSVFTRGKDSSTNDGNGHGTHVAGTIAAENNLIGVIGVAPGATVIPVKVLNSRGSGSYSGVIAGVEFVGTHGVAGDVANLSLGGPVSQAMDDAVVAASGKVKFFLAAGNESDDANNHSPARANGANVYTISAIAEGDGFAYFSNFGNPPVDYAAPGVAVLSTWKDGGYNTISGTSMATPHAAGVGLLGALRADGTATGDPDGNPDPIVIH